MTDYRITADERTSLDERAAKIASIGGGLLSHTTQLKKLVEGLATLVDEPTLEPDPHETDVFRLFRNVDLSDPTGWKSEDFTASNNAAQDMVENVEFSDEGLRVWGRNQVSPNGSPHTGADTKGYEHWMPNYGRVVVRARAPHVKGVWPCPMWLRPLLGSVGEIDLMENFGAQPRTAATLHNEYGAKHKMIHGNLPWADLPNPDPTAFHTYIMDKTPDRITISTDGIVHLDAGPAVPGSVPDGFDWNATFEVPNQRWYPRVTMQVGCGTSNPGCGTGSPAASWVESDILVTELKIYEYVG